MITESPFKVTSPEDLSPEEIKELFVKSYTELNILKNRKHTIIYGSRGNGKSMLLRFLEPKCQTLDLNLTIAKYLELRNAFVGVYIPFKEGYFNKYDLQSIDSGIAYSLSKHLINIHIIGCFVDIIEEQLNELLNKKRERDLSKRILKLFDTKNLHNIPAKNMGFSALRDVLLRELSYINEYLSECNFPGANCQYSGNHSDYSTLILPIFKSIDKIFPLMKGVSIFLLFDEGDRLYDFQKRYINSMLANRDHKYLSIKLASKVGGYNYFLAESDTRIQRIHDYESIFLDELYTHSKDTYFSKIREIANRRLATHSINTDVESFLPSSASEEKLFEKIKDKTADEWDNLAGKSRTRDKSNYIDKYATARLFQHLAKKKTKKRYSGFGNIVHYSSGIIRNFLQPCHTMYEKAVEKNHNFKTNLYISETVQNQVVYKSSSDFLREIDESIQELGKNSKKLKTTIRNLKKLINALGKLYYDRLTDAKSRDPRIISFALIDEPDDLMRDILDYAVRESFFHKVYTGSKSGGGKLECYVLNRALCPAFKLDLSSFRGRILLSNDILWELIKAPSKTTSKLLDAEKKSRTSSQPFLFDEDITDETYE